ncbi:hypothetical protein [Rhodococcus spongiicola]|uniref:Uncharacterized protein n=1 Tax=Rhodococcus spongiicola TaxID=2487352 RepID=A0A438B5Q8_9NOCA|nr:hypothetical protein [Rhodococcus spongiicola]RVW06283.1 hypothetical protein EF834_02195 [Rhodococcus spongiicola]
MTTPTDKLDVLLQQARAAAQKLADELEYALELVREEESLEVDLQQLVKDWNRARTELAMAAFGKSTLPDGGLDACEKAIAKRRRFTDLETEISRAQNELRYLEESPAGLAPELSDLIVVKREQISLLRAELASLTPPGPTEPTPSAPPAAAQSDPVPEKSAQPRSAPAAKQSKMPQPKRCGVCQSPKGRFERFEDRWCCAECLHLEREVASARRALAALNARPLEQSVSAASEVPGVAKIRAEGREAMYALAARRRERGMTPPRSQRPRKQSSKPGAGKRQTSTPTVDDLKQRWNTST